MTEQQIMVGLVGCAASKLGHPAPAEELYTGNLFQFAKAYCKMTCNQWYILSAKHGLVKPEEVIEPYDLCLADVPSEYRRIWAAMVFGQLQRLDFVNPRTRLLVHAGSDYAEPLARLVPVEQPLRGLRLGERLRWYHCQLAAIRRATSDAPTGSIYVPYPSTSREYPSMNEQQNDDNTPNTTEEAKPDRGPFSSPQEAEQHKPESKSAKGPVLYSITRPTGEVVFMWGLGNSESCLAHIARIDGYVASRYATADKAKVSAALANMSDEELAELGLSRGKGKKGK